MVKVTHDGIEVENHFDKMLDRWGITYHTVGSNRWTVLRAEEALAVWKFVNAMREELLGPPQGDWFERLGCME